MIEPPVIPALALARGHAGEGAFAVVLAAHGAGEGSAANAQVRTLAQALATRLSGPTVLTAFELGRPAFHEVLDLLGERLGDGGGGPRAVTVVPVMASDGYFARCRLPAGLRANHTAAAFEIDFRPPLGIHPRVVASVVAGGVRLLRAGGGANRCAVLVVAHGTPREPRSGEAAEAVARALRGALPGVAVATGFLDQPPALEHAALSLARGHSLDRLGVVPMLFGGGPHLERDLAFRLECVGVEVVVAPALGAQPSLLAALIDLVANSPARADSACGWRGPTSEGFAASVVSARGSAVVGAGGSR